MNYQNCFCLQEKQGIIIYSNNNNNDNNDNDDVPFVSPPRLPLPPFPPPAYLSSIEKDDSDIEVENPL